MSNRANSIGSSGSLEVPPVPAFFNDDLPNLDFLRAVAVLSVLLGHLTYFLGFTAIGPLQTLRMGGMGVGMFFVHTCFVLMLSLERQWKAQGRLHLFFSFMVRRLFRIYPLSIVIVSLVAAFHLPLERITPQQFFGLAIHPSLIASNILLVQGSGHSIVGPMWSLPYEMAMYLALPWLFQFLYPRKSYWRIAAIWLILIVACELFLEYTRQTTADYFLLYIPCFLPGVIAYQIQRSRTTRLPSAFWPAFLITCVLVFLYKENSFGSGWFRIWTFCLAIGVALSFFGQISARWLTLPSYLIAKYSYGIYLTHFFCIWLVFDRLHDALPRVARLGLFLAMVTALSVMFYHLLEAPMIRVGRTVSKRVETAVARKHLAPVRVPT